MIDTSGDRYSWAINLGADTGFTAYTLAGVSKRVVVSNFFKPMLRRAKGLGQNREISSLSLSQNTSDALPFKDRSVDLISARFSAHRFRDLEGALHEASRVLKIGGSLLMADSVAPEQDDIASWMNNIERRSDCNHIESRKISTITNILTDNGFRVSYEDYQRQDTKRRS